MPRKRTPRRGRRRALGAGPASAACGASRTRSRVCVSLPRRLLAMRVARRASGSRGWRRGDSPVFNAHMVDIAVVFDRNGLIPVVVQDHLTGDIRMFAHATIEAVRATLDTGRATFWSRSRNELWEKGQTSGN